MKWKKITCGDNIKTQSADEIRHPVGEKRNNQTENVFENSSTNVVKRQIQRFKKHREPQSNKF